MLNARALGAGMGAAYAAYMALLAWAAGLFRIGGDAFEMMAKFYPGYRPTFVGGLIGAGYGLLTGFALGWVTGWLYNRASHAERYVPGPFELTR